MAAWQAQFHVIPRRALAASVQPLDPEILTGTAWWGAASLPRDYHSRLNAFMTLARTHPGVERWGELEGNSVEIEQADGRVTAVRASVDVRRPDAKFAAGLILFVRSCDASLVRVDGAVTELTAGGFSAAMRGSPAWSTRG